MTLITGIVYKDKGRGRDLGYPTANIVYKGDEKDGVYIAIVTFNSIKSPLPALAFIGAPETFGEKQRRLEVFILDFSGNLYGKKIIVKLLRYMRGNIKFESADALIIQMKEDERMGREYFTTIKL